MAAADCWTFQTIRSWVTRPYGGVSFHHNHHNKTILCILYSERCVGSAQPKLMGSVHVVAPVVSVYVPGEEPTGLLCPSHTSINRIPSSRPSLLRLPCPMPPIFRSKTWEELMVMVCQLTSTSSKHMALIRGCVR